MAWYTCGPTTYAPAHMGHARTYVCLDIIRRVLTNSNSNNNNNNNDVLFVLNITDIDDKILQAAKEEEEQQQQQQQEQKSSSSQTNTTTTTTTTTKTTTTPISSTAPIQLARRFERDFWRDWDALHCLRPHVVTRVTEHVESHIVPFVRHLVEQQRMAYETDDGIYFDVRAYNDRMGTMTRYGKLAPPAVAQDIHLDNVNNNNNNTTTTTTNNASSNQSKKDPRDFVLWKKRKPDETIFWSSPWGNGRPGWHIECSAMIQAVQERFPHHRFWVHAGGVDLQFPHHTNEIAQSEAYLQTSDWIPHWVHTGHLHIDGMKMSKSLKNFVTIQEFLQQQQQQQHTEEEEEEQEDDDDTTTNEASTVWHNPADDFRLWCLGLSGSYRGPATFSQSRMAEAGTIRRKIVTFLLDGEAWIVNKHVLRTETSMSSTKKLWNDDEYDLFHTIQQGKCEALKALHNDLDGSTFLSELMGMVESGSSYLRKHQHHHDGPVEVMKHSLEEIRNLLRLVGFTPKTFHAGLPSQESVGAAAAGAVVSSTVQQTAVLDALVDFRSTVRKIALDVLRDSVDDNNQQQQQQVVKGMKSLLQLSDELRDKTLPTIGIQLLDSGSGGGSNSSKNNNNNNNHPDDDDDVVVKDTWKLCPPKPLSSPAKTTTNPTGAAAAATTTTTTMTSSGTSIPIPLEELFKVGQYENVFSKFTEDGIPTHNTDGTELSKRLLKKLLKKRDAHHHKKLLALQQQVDGDYRTDQKKGDEEEEGEGRRGNTK
ncbi:cysteinyl-tRNA synthetase [Nitzschia inconspicua]|uniref:Cysteinyl-tRNA synthetase n=1 Tax=Nitzschia inconspicua TaxID=303405 RepID=A0A9K3KSR2_9STRA|nr:cysteinyl-tRNA synthetase [Nitzschia inconspicua]